ncbi:MAG: PQQ-binding-like beta-propeller repeat protein [Planctomycetota bacterium]
MVKRIKLVAVLLAAVVSLEFITGRQFAQAGDWPQILGPNRDGAAVGEKLPNALPAGGLTAAWRAAIGEGYAGPAIAGDRVVVFHRQNTRENVSAFRLKTGEKLWDAGFGTSYRGGIDPDQGPRCVPVIAGDAVIAYGPSGSLHCVGLADGRVRWSRPVLEELNGDEGYFGAGSTPLVVDGLVLVNVGGRNNAGVAAFSLATGKTVWTAGQEDASYSAATLTQRDGRPVALFITRYSCLALEPATGKTLFRFPFGKRGPTVNAATPLAFDGRLFLTASYGIGAVMKRWDATAPLDSPTDVWANDDSLSSQYSTPVHYQGYLFGTHGREDVGRAALRCVSAKNGAVAWEVEDFGVANVIRADDKLLIVGIDGVVTLAKASPLRFEKLGTARLPADERAITRALPALASGRLVVRTNVRGGDGGELVCVPVAP